MALPSSGPLSLANIQTEFGGSNPIGMNEYYAGGAYVPAGTTGTYGAVPSSGAISIQNFYGTASIIPYFLNYSPNNTYYASTTSKNVQVLVGGFLYTALARAGSQETVVSKTSTSGVVSWAVSLSVPTQRPYTSTRAIAADSSGNVYIAMAPQANTTPYQLVKLNSSGAVVWSNYFTIPSVDPYYGHQTNLVIDSAGNLYMTGQCYSPVQRVSLIKFNSSGTFQWAQWIAPGTSGYPEYGLSIDPSDNIWISVSGGYLVKYNTSGTQTAVIRLLVSGTAYYPSSLSFDSSGNIYFCITDFNTYMNVVKLNSSYATVWSKNITVTGVTSRINPELVVLNSGAVIVSFAAFTSTVQQNYVVGLNSSGVAQWCNAQYGSQNVVDQNTFSNLTTNGTDSFYFVGATKSGTNAASATADFVSTIVGRLPADGSVNNGGWGLGNTTPFYYNKSEATTSDATAPTITSTSFTSNAETISPAATSTITATSYNQWSSKSITAQPSYGSELYTIPGTYTWICPAGVTSVSIAAVGGGGGGAYGGNTNYYGAGGGGGGLGWQNNYGTTPGSGYTVVVGDRGAGGPNSTRNGSAGGDSTFAGIGAYGGSGGGYFSGAGGAGGSTKGGASGYDGGQGGPYLAAGGGGAGGYTGAGGAGAYGYRTISNGSPGSGLSGGGGGSGGSSYAAVNGGPGGGIGLLGPGQNGAGGTGWTAAYGGAGSYGLTNMWGAGGGSGFGYDSCCCGYLVFISTNGSPGASGAVRILWPGSSRSFPSTNI